MPASLVVDEAAIGDDRADADPRACCVILHAVAASCSRDLGPRASRVAEVGLE
jgi:hypothetical protein